MAMEVLKDRAQIRDARKELERLGLSQLAPPIRRWIARTIGGNDLSVGDPVKSWDVLLTLEFIKRHVQQDEAILDIGCYASETLPALHTAGYTKLVGADLNPDIVRMPHAHEIRYELTDFMQTPFPDASFGAVTAISVIEHGFDGDRLLKEVSRLLRPGGYFIASFDYWPDKIDTSGVRFFDLDWLIFSKSDVERLVSDAAPFGLHPAGPMDMNAETRAILCGGKAYTFAWMVLCKSG